MIFNNLKFAHKLFLSYLVAAIIPIIILGFYLYIQTNTYISEKTVEGLKSTAAEMASSLNYKVEKFNNLASSMVFNIKIQQVFSNNYPDILTLTNDLRDFVYPFFSNLTQINDDVKEITVYSKTKMPEYNNWIRSYSHIEDAPWFQEAEENKGTHWFYSEGSLFAVRKLLNIYNEEDLGSVVVEVDYDRMFVNSLDINIEDLNTIVLDSGGNEIFANKSSIDMSRVLPVDRLMTMQEGVNNYNGKSWIVVKKHISNPQWTLYYYVPLSSVTSNSLHLLNTTIVIIAVCIIIVLLVISLFSRTIVRRIVYLNKKMDIVEKGYLNITVHSDSKDEIGELTNRFGSMIKKLHELIEEVYKSKLVQQEAEFKALQAQINPHFLYNSLSVVNAKAIQIGSDDISRMVTTMATFYRLALNKGENITSVENEMINTKAYIDIQLIMHSNKFDVLYNIDRSLHRYTMPKLTLQPLVENAMEHGIFNKREGRGSIWIDGSLKEGKMIFRVRDNGPGMSSETIYEVLSKNARGYGLKNVNDRIKLLFGQEYGLAISSELNKGTEVSVILPQK